VIEHLLYTRLARYYDVIYREYLERVVPRLVDVYESVFREYAGRPVRDVLDVACGTGGPTLELARRGYRVVGVDLHSEVVEIAREKAARSGLSVEFYVGDARSLDGLFPAESFDAVTMFFTSISYMATLEDLERLLRSTHYVLRQGGVFVADTPNPYSFFYHLGMRSGPSAPLPWSTENPEARETVTLLDWIEVANWAEGLHKLKRLVIVAGENGETRTYLIADTLRHYTATELTLAARIAGFNKAEALCQQEGRAVKAREAGECRRLILAAVKT